MDRKQAGLSLVELMISATILTVVLYVVGSLMATGSEAQLFSQRQGRSTEMTRDLLDEMRMQLISSVRLFGADAEGAANLATFELASAPVPLPDARLPTIRGTGSFQRDSAGDEITGNRLFLARHAFTTRFVCTSSREYRIDSYRWVLYYLSAADGGPQAGRPTGLDFVRVVGEPLADGAQIDRITDPADRIEVVQHLINETPDADGTVHPRVEVVWERGGDPTAPGTFRQIDPLSGALAPTPFGTRPNPWQVLPADSDGHGRLAYRHHSLATNFAPATMRVARFAILDATGAGFPHGFEVQIVGPSAARQVLLRLLVVSTVRRGQRAYSDQQILVDSRDL